VTRPRSIGGGQTVSNAIDVLKADAVFPDGRRATLDLVPAPPADQPVPVDLSPTEKVLQTPGSIRSIVYEHGDLSSSSGKGIAVVFWAFALITVGGALFVVSRRNLIAAVMGMVGSFLGIAAVYMMLYARFLAVVQLLVYAGAIMVLFVFVVMILNRPEDEPVAPSGRLGHVLGGLAIVYLVVRLILMLVNVQPPNPQTAMAAPRGIMVCTAWKDNSCAQEAISVLLLVAVVGAIAIARPLGPEDERARQRMEGGVA
jgi:NADH-quinone oxidoreductase subunit J